MRLFKTFPIYPVLLAIYLPLIALSSNWSLLSYTEILTVILISLVITGVVWFILYRFIKRHHTVAFIVLGLLLVFYLYGHIIVTTFILGIDFFTPETLALVFLLLFGLAVWVAFRFEERLKHISRHITIVVVYLTIVLLFINQPPFLRRLTRGESEVAVAYPIKAVEISSTATGYDGQLPDIYIIVLDAGPREDVFADMAGKELGFAQELETLGFYVAENSKSNYMFTPALLPTFLNFDYLPNLIDFSEDVDTGNAFALVQLIRDNRACQTFQSIGYQYLTFDSTWGPTRDSECADKLYGKTDDIQELSSLMVNTTALRLIFYDDLIDRIRQSRLDIYNTLIEISASETPTFTFAHILMPHGPFVFDSDGNVPKDIDQRISIFSFAGDDEHSMEPFYLAQSEYTAEITVATIQTILEESEIPPVIIIMSDHGPDMPAAFDNEYYEKRIPIFNAYYFPYGGDAQLYPSITPVNSLRVLLNYYFGADLPILEDNLYVSRWTDGIYYEFENVTTRTVIQNNQARIGIDWDENFYEVYEKSDGDWLPILRIDIEMLNTNTAPEFETSNGWQVTLTDDTLQVKEGNEQIISATVAE